MDGLGKAGRGRCLRFKAYTEQRSVNAKHYEDTRMQGYLFANGDT